MSEMIERVAKALQSENMFPVSNFFARRLALAVIAAMREPTRDMINAGAKEHEGGEIGIIPRCWRAMIDTALKPVPACSANNLPDR